MPTVHFTVYKCPKCKSGADLHIFHVYSLLGPAATECVWCGETVPLDRIEWAEMGFAQRAWYFGISLVYAALAYFLVGGSVDTGLQWLVNEGSPTWRLNEPTFWISGAVGSLMIVAIQILRVRRSRRRSIAEEQPLSDSFWTLDLGGQTKVLVLAMLFPWTAFGLSKFVFTLSDETRVLVQAGVLGFVGMATIGGIWYLRQRVAKRRRPDGGWLSDPRPVVVPETICVSRGDELPDCCVICGESETTALKLRFPPKDPDAEAEVTESGSLSRALTGIAGAIPTISWSLPFCEAHVGFPRWWQRLQIPLLLLSPTAAVLGVWSVVSTTLLWPAAVAIVVCVLALFLARPLSITPQIVNDEVIEFKSNDRFAAAFTEINQDGADE